MIDVYVDYKFRFKLQTTILTWSINEARLGEGVWVSRIPLIFSLNIPHPVKLIVWSDDTGDVMILVTS